MEDSWWVKTVGGVRRYSTWWVRRCLGVDEDGRRWGGHLRHREWEYYYNPRCKGEFPANNDGSKWV